MNKEFWKNKKVFVTGHTGFKGAWLCLCLNSLGAKVTGYSLEAPTQPSLYELANVSELIHSVIGDIRNFEYLKSTIIEANPDIVIHMAAQALVRESYQKPLETYAINVMGTANLLEAVKLCENVKAVVVVTTDKCYENKEWCWGYRENETLGGYDPYSSSKACAELVTSAYRNSFMNDEGISVATARAGNVIGGGDWAKDRLIPDCLKAIQAGQDIVIRNPYSIRPWQYVLEPISGYLLLAEKLYKEGRIWAESWNFGPNDQDVKSVGEIVKKICMQLNSNYKIAKSDSLHEATYLKLDCSKAHNRLKWSPKLNIDETLMLIVDWFQAYQNGANMQTFSLKQIEKYNNCLGR